MRRGISRYHSVRLAILPSLPQLHSLLSLAVVRRSEELRPRRRERRSCKGTTIAHDRVDPAPSSGLGLQARYPSPACRGRTVAEADDLHIAPFREDGVTYGTPTWIWSVAVEDALYVRGYNGQNSRWYQAAVRQKAGRITAAGITREVTFEPVDGPINDRIDDAYRAKISRQPVPQSYDRRPCPRSDSQGHATRDQCMIDRLQPTSTR